MAKRAWVRGALTLAVIGGLAAALVASPVGAAQNVTKAKAKNIARKQFNKLIGPATAGFLSTGDILVQAQDDPDGATQTSGLTGDVTVNTLSITAPSAGFLIISASIDLDNDTGTARFVPQATVDGTVVNPAATGTGGHEIPNTDPDELGFAFTVTRAVAAGPHTVTHLIDTDPAVSWDYNRNELTVLFVPTGAVARGATARGTGEAVDG